MAAAVLAACERLIRAAMDEIAAGRYEGLTVRNLAARLGVAPMSLYRHARDKEDLLAEVTDRLLAEAWEPAADIGETWAWIVEACDRFVRCWSASRPRCTCSCLTLLPRRRLWSGSARSSKCLRQAASRSKPRDVFMRPCTPTRWICRTGSIARAVACEQPGHGRSRHGMACLDDIATAVRGRTDCVAQRPTHGLSGLTEPQRPCGSRPSIAVDSRRVRTCRCDAQLIADLRYVVLINS
jgi:AcrR family transcriptional regulator